MGFFGLFKSKQPSTANLAKERLKIIVEHSRADAKRPDYLNKMRLEILEVVSKYVKVDLDDINTNIAQHGESEVLELNIVLPEDKVKNADANSDDSNSEKDDSHNAHPHRQGGKKRNAKRNGVSKS